MQPYFYRAVEAKSFTERCRDVISELEEAEAAAREGTVKQRGRCGSAFHPAFRNSLVRVLGGFLACNPGLNMEGLPDRPLFKRLAGLVALLKTCRRAVAKVLVCSVGAAAGSREKRWLDSHL